MQHNRLNMRKKVQYYIEIKKSYVSIRSIAEIAMSRNSNGMHEIAYGDLFLSRVDKVIQVSSFDISLVVARIHEQSRRM
jgi:hypothetical protein